MNTPENIFTPIGGRRFVMCMGCAIVCTALVWFGHISDMIFRDLIVATVGVYIAGNTSQKIFAHDQQN